ncbi:MAG TPA: hypothetical protein VLL52_02350 [Anaerolineae bacterium]|nr:hypothetical protein [Anaerolineae bacterium]
MTTSPDGISAALLAANQQLLARRQELRARASIPEARHSVTSKQLPECSPAPAPAPLTTLPPHLGWHSPAVTNTLRHSPPPPPAFRKLATPPPPNSFRNAPPPPDLNGHLKLYPTLALALLQQNHESAGRLWLLCRYLDTQGVGHLSVKQLRDQLTAKNSPWRLCGPRQLRNLIQAGEGLFWHRNNGRLWLRSLQKVLDNLNVSRLSGHPILLPIKTLLEGIGTVRAHFYASFHSGRLPDTAPASKQPKPIARETLTSLTGCSPSSQRRYETIAAVKAKMQIALGPQWSEMGAEEWGWERGTAVFNFIDHKGQHGPAGQTYLAWQLPNSYQGPHATCARGRQKQLNRHLRDLRIKGAGNEQIEPQLLYHHHGAQAVRAYNQAPDQTCYWAQRQSVGRYRIWGVLLPTH